MARPAPRPGTPRPRRTLLLFLALVVALYGLLVGVDLKHDDGAVWKPRLGLDLQGGTRITLQAEASSGDVTPEKLREARDIIDQRVNATGVSEAEVTTQGGNQVIIEIPGERRGNIVDQVGKTAQLRFRLVWAQAQGATGQPLDDAARAKAEKAVSAVDWTKLSLDQMIAAETDSPATLPKQYSDGVAALQQLAAGFQCSPDGNQVEDVPSRPLVTCDPTNGQVFVLSPSVIEGSQVKKAEQVYDSQRSQWVVSIAMRDSGSKVFDAVTTALTPQQKSFAIVLDGEVLSAPTSQAVIRNGQSQIQGSFTSTSSKALANQLTYGALPLTFKVNGVSVLAAGLALLMAAAVSYAMVLLLGQSLGFTLTLPGIAGLIVAIGITADSFIVLFERIRDEVRDGKSLRLAVESGWDRARRTILAADGVSLLAAVILFIFAIGVVRGFAFALGLTTIIDVIVVFLFTKPLMSLLASTTFFGKGHKLSGFDAAHLGIGERAVDQSGPARTRTGGRA